MADCVMDVCEDEVELSDPVLRNGYPQLSRFRRRLLACQIALLDEITLAEAQRQIDEQLTSGCISPLV